MPAVATPAAPPPAPEATIAPPNEPISFGAEIDADLAALDDETPKPAPAPAAPPAEKPPAKPKEGEGAKPAAQVKKPESVKPAEPQPETPKPVKAADLRVAYDGLKKRVREEFEPKIATLESKIKELESRKPEDTSGIIEELKSTKARRDELESEIKFLNYKRSSEFKEKYEKPYEEAWKKAVSEIGQLNVTDEEGNSRKATANDILQLANTSLDRLDEMAEQMFGRSAARVIRHVERIKELAESQSNALEQAQKTASEREKQLATQRQVQHQEAVQLWKAANDDLATKYPKWFAPTEGDTEGNRLLSNGFALADLHFLSAQDLTPEQVSQLPPRFRDAINTKGDLDMKDRVALDALLRHKIASHSRLAFKLKQANERIAELEKTVADYESSEPPSKGTARAPTGSKETSNYMAEAEAELDALDKD